MWKSKGHKNISRIRPSIVAELLPVTQRFWEADDLFAMPGVGKRFISAPQVENCVRRLKEEGAESFGIHLEALVLDGFG